MPPKSSAPSLAPPTQPLALWSDVPTSIDPPVPLPLEPYDESLQLRAPRGTELRRELEVSERVSNEVSGELGRLKMELSRKMKETTEMVKYLEAEVRRKDLMAKRMEKQLKDLEETHSSDLHMMERQFENTCKYMEKIFMEKERQILEKNMTLDKQIKDLAEFQAMRTSLANELEQTKLTIFKNERSHKLQLDELEKKFLSARDGLQREAAARIANSRATYKLEVGKELEAESTAVRLENEKLRDRLRTHEATSDRLQKQHQNLTTRIHELKQDLELRNQQNEEYLKKSLHQTRTINTLTEEVKTSEDTLLRRLREQDESRKSKAESHRAALLPLQQELIEVQSQSKSADRQHARLRREGQRLLREKEDTSRFFLEALQETRRNQERKKALQKKERQLLQQAQLRELTLPPSLRTRLPFIHGGGGGSEVGGGTDATRLFDQSTLAMGDLTLDEREKVLRLLYAKISHIPSSITMTLPAHSFDIQLANATPPDRLQQAHTTMPASNALSQAQSRALTPSTNAPIAGALSAGVDSHAMLMPPESQQQQQQQPDAPAAPSSYDHDMTFLTNMQPDDDDDDDGDDDDGSTSGSDEDSGFRSGSTWNQTRTQTRPISAADETD